MSSFLIKKNPDGAISIADVFCCVRKGKPPKNNSLAAIWSVERTVGYYYEIKVIDHKDRRAIFYIVPVATQNSMQWGVSYAAKGIGGIVYLQSERRFFGVETGMSPNGFAVVTLLFRMNNYHNDFYSFTAKFDPV